MYREIERRQAALAELRYSARRYLREENANILSEVLSSNGSSIQLEQLNAIYDTLRNNYETRLIQDILEDALKQVYNDKTPQKLLDDLFQIYQNPDDVKSFELMVRAQLILNAIHNSKGYFYDEYLQKFALIIFKIKNNSLFQNIDVQLKSGIERAIDQLPDYLKYLMFRPYFCMLNVGSSEFIYSAVNSFIDSTSRYLWLWYDKKSIDSTGHTKADLVDGIATNFDDFKITLFGTNYNVYYYLMPNSVNNIAGYPSSQQDPFNHIWTVQFKNDKIILQQNEYIMCSTERFDQSRRNVNGYRNVTGIDADNPQCQWSIGTCQR
ncbi:uncharacterized protein LOC135951158 [Calliphora vicina]|uniref:uncharacterized protein LOC135951158 n=1 Tax=Calliphora vicina TaxID=7373 RepID=UPI00325B814D